MKVGIIGLGLIGGSVALGATKAGHEVVGFDTDITAIHKGIDSKALNSEMSIESMSTYCDLIVVCIPPRSAPQVIKQALGGTAVVTDVSSVKTAVCESVQDLEHEQSNRFIGGHPMAGSEQSGFDSARDDMFENKMWVLVPPTSNSLKHIDIVETFVSSLGAQHCILSPQQHDSLVAHISHLPQLASSVLMDLAKDKSIENEIILRLAGGGFRDMTRIASNNTKMWLDIVSENKEEIVSALELYIQALTTLKQQVQSQSLSDIENLFTRAQGARRSLPEAARRLENLCEIIVPVPDKPGVLTSITSLGSDINIYDISIVHALEDDRGVLSLVVDPDSAKLMLERLENEGFDARVIQISSS